MARATTKPRRARSRARRRTQPFFLLWFVAAFAALVGVRQIAALQHELIGAPPPAAADAPDPIVETTRLDGTTHDSPVLDPGGALKDLTTAGRLRESAPVTGELRWVGPDVMPFVPDPGLAAQVNQRIAGRSGRYGIAIKDLRTGRGVLIDSDGRYEAASLFKLSVMYEVFKQREAGALSFSEPLTLTQRHVDFDLGTLDRSAGSSIGLGEAVERMVTISDNSSAILLTDRVGVGNITRDVERLGMMRTRLSTEDLSTSPGDMLTFFETIARGESVSREASADMLYLLARQRVNDRIPRLLPPGAMVAHKTGNLQGVVNDAGIVYAGDQVFVIAVLVDGTRQDAEASRITSELAAIALEHFRSIAQRDDAAVLPLGDLVPTPGPWPTALTLPTPVPIPTATPTAEIIEVAVPSVSPLAITVTAIPAEPELRGNTPAATAAATIAPTATPSAATPTTIVPPVPATSIERGVIGPERRVPGGGGATATPARSAVAPLPESTAPVSTPTVPATPAS
jgi:beta-lactamase class A